MSKWKKEEEHFVKEAVKKVKVGLTKMARRNGCLQKKEAEL